MQKSLTRIGVLAIAPLLLLLMSGCGWEPLRPGPHPDPTPGDPQVASPVVLKAQIVYDCEKCVISQDQSKKGEAPLVGHFSAKVTLPDPTSENVIFYGWDFGDSTKGEGAQIDHTFQNPGTYRVNLRIITSRGNEAYDKVLVITLPMLDHGNDTVHQEKDGDLCTFERIVPKTIYKGVPFKVQIVILTHQKVQVVQWEDDIWPPEFRLKQEPSGVWLMVDADQRISLQYDAQLWNPPVTNGGKLWMSGTVKCNAGGLGDSEILDLKTNFDDISTQQ
ncbi:PKD domain-containing protein [Candidatus Acetothermia bacterium]|nr:PKD domain-containing protein [Candidatus Acetothermia bacterium]MBI3643665.1 PKD domain-containing protein [Candidatus Acetothermia bacterium]